MTPRASGSGQPPIRDEGGFALVAVLLVMALMGVLGAEFAYSMRLEAASVRAYRDNVIARHLAEAAFEQAVREIVADAPYVALADDGLLTFYTRDRIALRRRYLQDTSQRRARMIQKSFAPEDVPSAAVITEEVGRYRNVLGFVHAAAGHGEHQQLPARTEQCLRAAGDHPLHVRTQVLVRRYGHLPFEIVVVSDAVEPMFTAEIAILVQA